MTSQSPKVGGRVSPGFERVREVFVTNFEQHAEVGAAFAATVDGKMVVDLWGGLADSAERRPWGADTIQPIFSGTKGLVALCLLILVDRGQLDLEASVADYWPEFAANGKRDVRVAEIASHRARLPGLGEPIDEEQVVDDRRMAQLLAAQPMERDPRAANAYHPLTFGWLCGELVRRVDGRSVGRFFDEEVAVPLALEAWIGLPSNLERRVAVLEFAGGSQARDRWDERAFANDELLSRVWANPPVLLAPHMPWNRPSWHQAEIAGAGAIATARSMARLYGCLACGGALGGVRLLSDSTLELGLTPRSRRWDPLLAESQAFATGFQLQAEHHLLGPPSDAFGHGGAGGSMHGAWPASRAGFSYCMNSLGGSEAVDPRARALLTALDAALN